MNFTCNIILFFICTILLDHRCYFYMSIRLLSYCTKDQNDLLIVSYVRTLDKNK